MKKLTTLFALVLCLCLCSAAMAETVFQLGTTVNEQDSFQVAAEKFAELVAERTNGEYKIEIYPNGTLGGESDMLDSMSMGMLDMGIITSGPFVNFSEMMGVLDMPYLFATNEEAYEILDGEIGQELLGTLEEAGLKGLAYAERGFRNRTVGLIENGSWAPMAAKVMRTLLEGCKDLTIAEPVVTISAALNDQSRQQIVDLAEAMAQ